MKIKELTLKKAYGKKVTIKTETGGFDSEDNQAEVTITFEGDINLDEAEDLVRRKARSLLDDDPKWLKEKDKP